MANYKAKGKLVLLDNHLATGTEADYTYTETLDMKVKYREIKIIITGVSTAALVLQMIVSANTDYNFANIKSDSGGLTAVEGTGQTSVSLMGSALIDGAVSFHAEITIHLNDANDTMEIASRASSTHEGMEFMNHADTTTATTISSIKIQTSTSTWIAGTEISTYGLKR